MNLGGTVELSIDFGRGPMRVGIHPAAAPAAPEEGDIAKVTHMGADITDQLTEEEIDRITEAWRLEK
jgi:hypothetical protein